MIAADVYRTTLRYFLRPIQPLLDDESVSEVMVVGPECVYFERDGRIHRSECRFPDEASLRAALNNISEFANRQLDQNHHSMDARLPDGQRVHAIVPPASQRGICLTIRKFQRRAYDLAWLVSNSSLSPEAAEFLELAVLLHKNVVISGGTGTGKTCLLNALSAAIPADERIIVIEDTSELRLHQPHTVYLEAQPPRPDGHGGVTIRDLFVDSLRMRPDRIIVGEVRQGEALDLVQSMISGHAGALTTVHANSPRDAASRLETLCLLSDAALPVYVARSQVASAVHLVVQLMRLADGSRRVHSISELRGLDEKQTYCWQDLYRFQGRGLGPDGRVLGELTPVGMRPSFAAEPFQLGYAARVQLTQRMFSADESAAEIVSAAAAV